MKTQISDLKCRSMKNNLIFTGRFESPREDTQVILREYTKNEIGIEEYKEFGNVHQFNAQALLFTITHHRVQFPSFLLHFS
jgi:hypothetical protein